MRRISLSIFLLCFACISGFSVAIALTPTALPTPLPIRVMTQTISPTTVPTENVPILGTFTVIVSMVYVRDHDDNIVSYLSSNDTISCHLSESGWCIMENNTRIWGGCLAPNPQQLGCEAK